MKGSEQLEIKEDWRMHNQALLKDQTYTKRCNHDKVSDRKGEQCIFKRVHSRQWWCINLEKCPFEKEK
jgi:hypothetical protein